MRWGAVRSRKTRVSTGALLGGVVGSDVEGHMVASEPSWMVRWGLEPQYTWLCRSPPRQRGGVQSVGTRGNAGALPKQGGGFQSRDGMW
jgi:hypothetical protein